MANKKQLGATQEKNVARRLAEHGIKAELVPFSGAGTAKGDVATEELLIECKVRSVESEGKSIRFTFEWLTKIRSEAAAVGKVGIVVARGKFRKNSIAMIDFDDFVQLLSHKRLTS